MKYISPYPYYKELGFSSHRTLKQRLASDLKKERQYRLLKTAYKCPCNSKGNWLVSAKELEKIK